MRKWIFIFLFLIPLTSFGAKKITIGHKESYSYKVKNPIAVIPFNERRAVQTEIKENEVVFYGTLGGENLYQILTPDGMEEVILFVDLKVKERRQRSSRSRVYHGSLRFFDFYRTSNYRKDENNFNLSGNLHYKTGEDSYFYGLFTTNKRWTTYYLKYSQNKFFVGHGYKFVTSKAFPNFYYDESVKLTEAGYEGKKFNFTAWRGKLNEFVRGGVNRGDEEDVFGLHSHYIFGENDRYRLDLDYFNNEEFGYSAPYVNLRSKINDEFIVDIGGGHPEKPMGTLDVFYNRQKVSSWGLARGRFSYFYAPEGQEQLFYEYNDIQEVVDVSLDFYGKDKGKEKGDIFLTPGYQRYLRGNYLRNRYSLNAGFSSSLLKVGSRVIYSDIDFTPNPLTTTQINPYISFYLRNQINDKIMLTLYQRHFDSESPLGTIFENDFSYSALKLSRNKLSYNIFGEIGRGNRKSRGNDIETLLFSFGGKYIVDKWNFGTRNTLLYYNGNNGLDLGTVQASVYTTWRPTRDHSLQLSLNQRILNSIDNSFEDRESTFVKLNYTYRFGGDENPVKKIFTGKSVSGIVFEDLNANGVVDIDEPRVKDIDLEISGLNGGDKDKSSSDGAYSFSGLTKGNYTLAVKLPEKYKNYIASNQSAVNIDSSDQTINIPLIKTKKVLVNVLNKASGKIEDQEVNVKCDDSNYEYPAYARSFIRTEVYIPYGHTCSIYPVFKNNASGVKILNPVKKETKDFEDEYTIEIKKENFLYLQAIDDKNLNKVYDFGEELEGLTVFIGKEKMKTDISGEIIKSLDSGVHKVKVYKKGYSCKIKNDTLVVQKNEYQDFKTFIRCMKK